MAQVGGARQFSQSYPCGCSFVAWKAPVRAAETYGWHLCPEHMEGYQTSRQNGRREFRIKHPCRCYYVVWRTNDKSHGFGWSFCEAHAADYRRFQSG